MQKKNNNKTARTLIDNVYKYKYNRYRSVINKKKKNDFRSMSFSKYQLTVT